MLMDSPVSDGTAVSGNFVFELVSAPPRLPSPDAGDSAGTPFTAALRDQLGLRFDSRRGPIDVLVIGSVAKPTEN